MEGFDLGQKTPADPRDAGGHYDPSLDEREIARHFTLRRSSVELKRLSGIATIGATKLRRRLCS